MIIRGQETTLAYDMVDSYCIQWKPKWDADVESNWLYFISYTEEVKARDRLEKIAGTVHSDHFSYRLLKLPEGQVIG